MSREEMSVWIFALSLVGALVLGIRCGVDAATDATSVAACGQCDSLRECGELACVPGQGWLKVEAP